MSAQEALARFVAAHFRSALAGRVLGPDDPLLSSGVVDSFGLLELIAFVEDAFGVSIDPARHGLGELETVNRIAALIERLRAGAPTP